MKRGGVRRPLCVVLQKEVADGRKSLPDHDQLSPQAWVMGVGVIHLETNATMVQNGCLRPNAYYQCPNSVGPSPSCENVKIVRA